MSSPLQTVVACTVSVTLAAALAAEPAAPAALDSCNVVFTTPSPDARGAVPLGNGALGASVWVEPSGDVVLYLSHTDTFSEASRLLKIGKVRLRCVPALLAPETPFRQELRLRDGSLEIALGGARLTVYVEADRPVLRIAGTFPVATAVTVLDEGWRRTRTILAGPAEADEATGKATRRPGELGASWTMDNAPADLRLSESADVPVPAERAPAALAWFHHNADSVVPVTLAHQGCADLPGTFDPLRHRTFGAWIAGPGLVRGDAQSLTSRAPATTLDLRLACPVLVTPDPANWVAAAQRLADTSDAGARQRTADAWAAFWNRSWIFAAGEGRTPIPDNHHPVRIGIDSNGENRFPGTFGRVGVYTRPLSEGDIAALAAGQPQEAAPAISGDPGDRVLDLASPAPGTVQQALTDLPLERGLTWSAWIRPERLEPGRIVDRMTANHEDGVLFDTWPGKALRLIVGPISALAPDVLEAGTWQHVAATYDPATAAIRLYRNGQRVGGTGPRTSLSQAYQLQRYAIACQSRGEFAPKFNGGIFTVDDRLTDAKGDHSPDWRRWGDSYWFQNTRLIYHPMLMAGDSDLMEPLWALYRRPRALAEARSAAWYGSQGSWIPETMTLFGTYANKDYGWKREGLAPGQVASPWWRWAWNQTPELIDLLLKRWAWTEDDDFARRELLPQAESLLRYFDTRFRRDDRGLLVIDPAQSAETYWHGVVNDLPNIAGLRSILPRLRALPERLTTPAQRALFDRLGRACPAIPVGERETKEGKLRVILPAERFEDRTNNCENTEQYAIWPFAQYGVGKPDLELARTTYRVRKFDLPNGWGYDSNTAAMLGLTDEAARILGIKIRNSHPNHRFPATWGPNFDWLPDNCHGGNLMLTSQLMLMQCDGDTIRLLPAWPAAWDVEFRLHAPGRTVVSGQVRQGRLVGLDVQPARRRADVVVCPPFTAPVAP